MACAAVPVSVVSISPLKINADMAFVLTKPEELLPSPLLCFFFPVRMHLLIDWWKWVKIFRVHYFEVCLFVSVCSQAGPCNFLRRQQSVFSHFQTLDFGLTRFPRYFKLSKFRTLLCRLLIYTCKIFKVIFK